MPLNSETIENSRAQALPSSVPIRQPTRVSAPVEVYSIDECFLDISGVRNDQQTDLAVTMAEKGDDAL